MFKIRTLVSLSCTFKIIGDDDDGDDNNNNNNNDNNNNNIFYHKCFIAVW